MKSIVLALLSAVLAQPVAAQMIQVPKGIPVGYYTDARPISFDNESGKPTGYAVDLCQQVAQSAKAQLGPSDAQVEWVAVTAESGVAKLRAGNIKLLCGVAVTRSATDVLFSVPIFEGGAGAMLRTDTAAALKQALAASPRPGDAPLLQAQTYAVIAGAPTEKALSSWFSSRNLTGHIVRVEDEAKGVQAVVDRKVNVFFAERSVLLDAWRRNASYSDLTVLAKRFTTAPVALGLKSGDDAARAAVDQALAKIYGTKEFAATYTKWFGKPDAQAIAFFNRSMKTQY
ncbi:MAG: transporter substrate-binding domain-containing protein [Betaproteobacteria bacterium]|nr:transporter substrate-binding domain-containing protein [Betaproteobacteria bacterium]